MSKKLQPTAKEKLAVQKWEFFAPNFWLMQLMV